MVAELLYLEKQGATLPIEMLINSSGTTRQDGEIVSRQLSTGFIDAQPALPHSKSLYSEWAQQIQVMQ